ncbi:MULTISPECIES: tape measure protein [unclassified Rhodococcus (in: high G+C Gram-positive bacteria)]|uniref:tape measure protein n=1 Tax=unclassified Rhodococcus (in: high G+C Gram-positive bacteria) TaxID=192944 RepID=UPI000925B001|nr:tape measure protein [Rhodococcus sp. M8]OLL21254.1 hypothetical protein BKE56_015720 [Rhodococcus sp. M8]
MAVELGTGYISIVPETSRIAPGIRQALSNTGSIGEQAGRDIGGRMSTALGGALKAGAVGAGAVVAGVLGTAITKGIGRLTAIDDAEGKLAGLGHSAASTAKIMDSALASVKGTAYGLGDAATIAASAVAAGIKPGEELTKYLKLIGDAATIGGSSLSEMGSIINQTTTSGIVFTDTLNQLADRGIPIFTWLQDEYKVTGAELRKMVEDGQVDAATFQRVIEENIGGAALAGGETVRGAFANMNAALGRFGAKLAEPIFDRAAGGFTGITKAIDEATTAIGPFVDRFDEWLGSDGIPKMQEFGQTIADMWEKFSNSQFVTGSLSQISGIFADLLTTGQALIPSVVGIATALSDAAAAIGISSWQLLLNTLDAVAPILDATLVPALERVSELMQENQGITTALVGGFALFETVPNIIEGISGPFEAVTSQISGAFDAIRNLGSGMQSTARVAGYGQVQMGRFGSAIQRIGQNVPIVGAMQTSFLNAAAGAERFGRTAGIAAAASTGLKAAAMGVANAFGGPLIAGIGAAILLGTQLAGAADDVSTAQQNAQKSAIDLAEAQDTLAEAFARSSGAINDNVMSALTDQVDTFRQTLSQTAADAPGFWSDVLAGFGYEEVGKQTREALQEAGRAAEETSAALDKMGASNADIAAAISGSDTDWNAFIGRLRDLGGASDDAVAALQSQRDEFQKQQDAAKNLTPGMVDLSDAIGVLADVSATADQKTSALRQALVALGIIEADSAQVMADYGEAVAEIVAKSGAAVDATVGLGSAMLDANGKLDTFANSNARALNDALSDLGQNFLAAAQQSGNAAAEYEKAAPALQALADSYGLPIEKIQELARSYGMVPDVVQTLVLFNGTEAVEQQLGGIALRLQQIDPDQPKTVTVMGLTDDAITKLTDVGLKVERLPDGTVRVTAETQDALNRLAELERPRNVTLNVRTQMDPAARAAYFGSPNVQGPFADGGFRLPDQATIQPGRGAGLVQWAEGETGGEAFIPLAQSKRGRSVQILSEVADRFGMRLEAYADGGIRRAMDAAYAGTGKTYLWGGTGPNGWDCSGWVGYLQQILMGLDPASAAGRRLYTTYSLLGGSTAGLEPGAGPAGTVFIVGTSDEHMAATLNGQPAESGGAHGTSRIGAPAVGAFDPQFHSLFHLPNELIDGGVGVDASGQPTFGAQAARENPWTEKDQLDLESARISVQQAKEARDKVYNDEKKSDADRAQADLKVQRAELKVRELEQKRDGVGTSQISTEPAPPLTGEMGEGAIQVRQAEIAVLDAQLARDKVYNDPDSTSLDKEKADIAVHSAKNSLDATRKRVAEEEQETASGKSGAKSGEFSLTERIKKYGSDVFGILVDAVIEQASPFGKSRWLDIPLPEFTPPEKGATTSSDDKGRKLPLADIPSSFPDVNKQLGFNPAEPPEWIEKFLKKAPKVFDNGGWLMPGEMGINLSSRPEPIFNSPQQLLRFAGSSLSELVPAAPPVNDFSVHINNPQFANESKMMRAARDTQERKMMRYGGRP